MKKSAADTKKYNEVTPSGVCRMGNIEVIYYKLNGNRLWFDRKHIEKVLTGKNQHNLLGQQNDPKNHARIFDMERKELIDIISKNGVQSYLQVARSVKDENRFVYYNGLKNIENSRKEIPEPIQMPLSEDKTRYVKIVLNGDEPEIHTSISGNSSEKNNTIVQILLSAAQKIMTGQYVVS